MRVAVRNVVISALSAIVAPDDVVSGDADSVQARPFVNLQWAESTPGVGPIVRRSLVIWFHDEPGDYARIDQMVRAVRAALDAAIPVQGNTGWVSGVTWVTDSGDLSNEDRGTIVRTSTYFIVGGG